MSQELSIELHFEELFRGETTDVFVNEERRASFAARTRLQISLAHTEVVSVKEGDTITIRIAGAGEESVKVEAGARGYRINLVRGNITIRPIEEGYGHR